MIPKQRLLTTTLCEFQLKVRSKTSPRILGSEQGIWKEVVAKFSTEFGNGAQIAYVFNISCVFSVVTFRPLNLNQLSRELRTRSKQPMVLVSFN